MPEPQVFWYGDNLSVMRDPEAIAPGSVDLIYLDPPFNSERRYNVPLAEEDGSPSEAQLRAFEDYWKWSREADDTFDELVRPGHRRAYVPSKLSQTMELLRTVLGDNNLLAYLTMMAVRLVEMVAPLGK